MKRKYIMLYKGFEFIMHGFSLLLLDTFEVRMLWLFWSIENRLQNNEFMSRLHKLIRLFFTS